MYTSRCNSTKILNTQCSTLKRVTNTGAVTPEPLVARFVINGNFNAAVLSASAMCHSIHLSLDDCTTYVGSEKITVDIWIYVATFHSSTAYQICILLSRVMLWV